MIAYFWSSRRVGLQLPNTAASAAWAAQPQIPAAVTAQGAPIQQPTAAGAPTIIPAYPATMQQFQVSTQYIHPLFDDFFILISACAGNCLAVVRRLKGKERNEKKETLYEVIYR